MRMAMLPTVVWAVVVAWLALAAHAAWHDNVLPRRSVKLEWIEDGPPPLEAVPLPPPSTMGSCSAEPAIPGPSKKADCGQQKTVPNTSANRKRKRVQERDNVFNSIREENSNLKKRSLQIMEEKHVKELEVLDSVQNMCNTVNQFFSKLVTDYDKIFKK